MKDAKKWFGIMYLVHEKYFADIFRPKPGFYRKISDCGIFYEI